MGYSQLGAISKPLAHKVTAWELISAVRVDSGTPNKPSEIAVNVQGYTFVYCQWYIQNGDGSTVQMQVNLNTTGTTSNHEWTQMYGVDDSAKQTGSGSTLDIIKGVLPTDGWGATGYFLYAKPLGSSEGHLIGFSGGDYGDTDNYLYPTLTAGIFDNLSQPMTVVRFANANNFDNFSAQLWGVR
tara:strand:- start:1601 stop:2152 length:552 start_codon:yes stop_codon:yes gene_type:complete